MSSDLLSVVLGACNSFATELGLTAAARLSMTSWANNGNLAAYIHSEDMRLRRELPADICMMHILKVTIESYYNEAVARNNIAEQYAYFVKHGFVQDRMVLAYQAGSENDVLKSRSLSPHANYVQQIEVQAAHTKSFDLTESEKHWGKADWRLERLPGFRPHELQDHESLKLYLTLLDHIKMGGHRQPPGSLMNWIYWFVRLTAPPNINRMQTQRALWSLVDRISAGRIVFVGPNATPFPAVLTELRSLLMQWAGVKDDDTNVAGTDSAMYQMLHPIYPTPECWDGFDENAAMHVCAFPPYRAALLPIGQVTRMLTCHAGPLSDDDD